MRMRKKPNLDKRLARCESLIVSEPEKLRGKWSELSKARDIYVEIGCGKGRFITETAAAFPDKFFVGIEREPDALVMALEKAMEAELSNILFISLDATDIEMFFKSGEVAGIYLNFSDPWHKNRQAKRRLTHGDFLVKYNTVLKENGWIYLKTDKEKFFEYSLNSFSDFGFRLKNITFDLHSTDFPNIMTEYEERFTNLGMQIYRAEAHKYVYR